MTNETTASQPKSIGDDARFSALIANLIDAHSESDAAYDFCRRKLVELINNFRAPAAQASSAIQAAPPVPPTKEMISSGMRWLTNFQHMRKADKENALSEAYFAMLAAAPVAIQEPVMVAEPVVPPITIPSPDADQRHETSYALGWNAARKWVIDNTHTTSEEEWAIEHEEMNATGPDAPMVADPAGVAVDHDEAVTLLSAVFDAWENGDDCHEDGDPSATYMGKAFKLDDEIFDRCCALINRLNPPRNISAATVKAVPSEALDREIALHKALDKVMTWIDNWTPEFTSDAEWPADRDAAHDALDASHAAPLADKTGGGE